MTQMELARRGIVSDKMRSVARDEGLDPEVIRERVESGRVVIPCNINHKGVRAVGIGEGLKVKVNANIGSSEDLADPSLELKKLKVAIDAGADTVMDLSTGGDLDAIRKLIIENSPLPVGTVPIYQAVIDAVKKRGALSKMTEDDIFEAIRKHAEDGVDFMTVHCGVTKLSLERIRNQGRTINLVSRGGAFLAEWIIYTGKENPLYERFDDLLDIAREYDVTLSLGDGLRPGALVDASDRGQMEELIILGELVQRAREAGVQVMVEGPGHIPLNEIEMNILMEKRMTDGAPFYVLGPVVTDVAPGYDHITGAIGGALAAYFGADFLCYVTPAEHLKLPDENDVKEGVIATRIAAHAADLARGNPIAWEWDRKMAEARRDLNWEAQLLLSMDKEKARLYRESSMPSMDKETCTMCGEFCSIKKVRDFFKKGR